MGTPARDSLMMLSSRQDQKENQQNTRKNRAYQELKREIEHKKKLKEKVRLKKYKKSSNWFDELFIVKSINFAN